MSRGAATGHQRWVPRPCARANLRQRHEAAVPDTAEIGDTCAACAPTGCSAATSTRATALHATGHCGVGRPHGPPRCSFRLRAQLGGSSGPSDAPVRSRGAWFAACVARAGSEEPCRRGALALPTALPGRCSPAVGPQRSAVLGDQAVLLELADVAVQIGSVDAEFGRDVPNGDPGLVVDQSQDVLLTARLALPPYPAFVRRCRRAPRALSRARGGGLRGRGARVAYQL
jgi:hypothetical protein